MEDYRGREPTTKHYTRAIKQSMRRAIKIAYDSHPDVVNTAQVCLESFIKTERVVAINRYPREYYAQEQHCLVAIDYSDRIAKKRFNFLDAREDLGNLAVLYEEFAGRDPRAAITSLRLFRSLVQTTSELAALIENHTRVQKTNWQAVLDAYPLPSTLIIRSENSIAHCLPRLTQITEIKLLGAGGFGAIYHICVGNINLSGKLVPVGKFKTMKQACAEKIVGSMVNNPLLVRYYACYQTCQANVTMMEYVRGIDLQRIIGTMMSILTDEVNKVIIAQLGLALQYLHYRGFIHRDIKPSNVMILPGCRIKLIDFDTCKICVGRFLSGNQNSFIRRTFVEFNDGESSGTLYFLPPEILRKKPYGRAMDWWAVGVTSYQLLTGKLPFRGITGRSLKERIKRGQVNYPYCNFLHQELTKKLLVKFPTKRITSARFEEFRNDPWFIPIDWHTIIHQRVCADIEPLNRMFDIRNGVYSPKTEEIVQKHKGKVLLTFSQLYDVPPQEQDPICLVLAEGFKQSLRRMQNGEPTSEADIIEPYEYADTNIKFSKYKFIDHLVNREKVNMKNGLSNDGLEQEVITEQHCSSEDEKSQRMAIEVEPVVTVAVAVPSEDDEIVDPFTHAALLANTKPV